MARLPTIEEWGKVKAFIRSLTTKSYFNPEDCEFGFESANDYLEDASVMHDEEVTLTIGLYYNQKFVGKAADEDLREMEKVGELQTGADELVPKDGEEEIDQILEILDNTELSLEKRR